MSSSYLIVVVSKFCVDGGEKREVRVVEVGGGMNLFGDSSISIYTPASLKLPEEFCEEFIELESELDRLVDNNPHSFDDLIEAKYGNIQTKMKEMSELVFSKL